MPDDGRGRMSEMIYGYCIHGTKLIEHCASCASGNLGNERKMWAGTYDAGRAAQPTMPKDTVNTVLPRCINGVTVMTSEQPSATPGQCPTPTNETEAALQHVNWLINDGFHQMFMAVVRLRDSVEEALAATKEPKV